VPERLRIIVAGGAGAMPFAGVAWQVAQYLEGFRRLGHEVLYLEDTERWPYDPVAETVCDDAGPAIEYVARLAARCGLEERWAYRDVAQNGALHGITEPSLAEWLAAADVLVNVTGVMVLREEHLRIPARIYLETDPVLAQIEVAEGREFTIEFLSAHTHLFTYGANFGAPDCQVPIERFAYHATRPPVILDWWAPSGGPPELGGRPFTTVSNWHQTEKDIVWQGRKLTWSKDVQFRRFASLPRNSPVALELAVASEDPQVVGELRRAGWQVRSAGPLSKDLDAYRDYIRASAGEFSIAKEQYVLLRSGWFSDRTACYLAAGKPAIVQDTGFGCALPTGEGLFAFTTVADALAALELVRAEYPRHAGAALELASRYFRAETVLEQILDEL
jgi:glycosyltransferase involved in cell wall biosynthesis